MIRSALAFWSRINKCYHITVWLNGQRCIEYQRAKSAQCLYPTHGTVSVLLSAVRPQFMVSAVLCPDAGDLLAAAPVPTQMIKPAPASVVRGQSRHSKQLWSRAHVRVKGKCYCPLWMTRSGISIPTVIIKLYSQGLGGKMFSVWCTKPVSDWLWDWRSKARWEAIRG